MVAVVVTVGWDINHISEIVVNYALAINHHIIWWFSKLFVTRIYYHHMIVSHM